MNKRISEYQNRLRSMLNKPNAQTSTNANSLLLEISSEHKEMIVNKFGKSIEDIYAHVMDFLKNRNRKIFKISFNTMNNKLTPCPHKGGSCVASFIMSITFIDNNGYNYKFEKKEFGSDPAINHDELKNTIFFGINGHNFSYNTKTPILSFDSLLENIPSFPIANAYHDIILDYVNKENRFDLLNNDIVRLINYIEINRK